MNLAPDNREMATRSRDHAAQNTAFRYWSNQDDSNPDSMGTWGFGGAGAVELRYRHHEEVRHFLKIVPLRWEMALLEMGCGAGRWAVSLAPLVRCYEGVDFSEPMLVAARARVRESRLNNVTFTQAFAQDYEPQGLFNVIYLAGVSQYLSDAELSQLLRRLSPHLCDNGLIVDRSTANRTRRTVIDSSNYMSIYRTREEIVALFAASGFKNDYCDESYDYLSFPSVVQRLLVRSFVQRPISATAPLSFSLLRMAAKISRRLFGLRGEAAIYSHDFFLFGKANGGRK